MANSTLDENSSNLDESRQAYMLPHSQREIERMKNQHEWVKAAFGGLIKAPVDYEQKNQSILDSATADGESNVVWSYGLSF